MTVEETIEWLKKQPPKAIVRVVEVNNCRSCPSETSSNMVEFTGSQSYLHYSDGNKSICFLDLGNE